MNKRSLKTVAALCATFIVVAAAAVSAHAKVREVQSTLRVLERTSAIVRWVLVGDSSSRPREFARSSARVQASQTPEAPVVPAAPAAPRSARPTQAPRSPQAAPAPIPDAAPTAPARPVPPGMRDFQPDRVDFRGGSPVIRVNQNYTVRAGENVEDVVLVAGSLRVEGRVRRDVVVVFGKVTIASTGVIEGDLVNVGGGVDVDSGGTVHGDLVTIAGALGAAANFSPGGEQVVIGSSEMGDRVRAFVPWLTSGLLLGRVVVPGLPWVWVFLAIAFFVTLVLGLVFEGPVRASATSIAAKPLTTFLTGLLVLLLIGPVSFLLAVSVVGIVALPFLLCSLLIATVIGKIAVTRWLGWSIVRESDSDSRAEAVRSLVIGFVLLTLAYMVPVLGLVTWVTVSVLGLGGATATMFRALRKENPAPPKPPAPVPPPEIPEFRARDTRGPDMPIPPPIAPPAPIAYEPLQTPERGSATAEVYPSLSAPPETATDHGVSGLLALPRASFAQRVAGALLDCFLVFLLFLWVEPHNRELFWFLAMLTMYNVAFWTWRGTTVGGIICRLRVIRTDGKPLSWEDSAVRGLASVFSLLALGIGFFWILLGDNRQRQAWHDLIAGTIVVRVPQSTPLR
ncbi:MAG: RDD family protein [Acidobacteriota bacterium]